MIESSIHTSTLPHIHITHALKTVQIQIYGELTTTTTRHQSWYTWLVSSSSVVTHNRHTYSTTAMVELLTLQEGVTNQKLPVFQHSRTKLQLKTSDSQIF